MWRLKCLSQILLGPQQAWMWHSLWVVWKRLGQFPLAQPVAEVGEEQRMLWGCLGSLCWTH